MKRFCRSRLVGVLLATLTILPVARSASNTQPESDGNASTAQRLQAELEEEAVPALQLAQSTAILRVVDSEGRPVPGIRVGASVYGGTKIRQPSWRFRGQTGVTDDEGRILLPLDNLFARVQASVTACAVYAWDVPGEQAGLTRVHRNDEGRQLHLTVHPVCRIVGELRCDPLEKTGRSVDWAMVEVWHKDHRILEYESTSGTFEFFLPPGEFQIRVRGPGFKAVDHALTIAPDDLERDLSIDLSEVQITTMPGSQPPQDTQPADTQPAADEWDGPPSSDWQERFDAVYRLEEGEVLKWIAPPLIPERLDYYRAKHAHQAEIISRPPDYFQFRWDDSLRDYGYGFGESHLTLPRVLGILGLASYQYEISPELTSLKFAGDWILRDESSAEERLHALAAIIEAHTDRKIAVEKRAVERDVVEVRGWYAFRPLTGIAVYDDHSVHLFSDKLDPDEGAGGGTRDFTEFLDWVGNQLSRPVINEASAPTSTRIVYANHRSSYLRKLPEGPEKQAKISQLLANLARQTSLQFTPQRRSVEVWFMAEDE